VVNIGRLTMIAQRWICGVVELHSDDGMPSWQFTFMTSKWPVSISIAWLVKAAPA